MVDFFGRSLINPEIQVIISTLKKENKTSKSYFSVNLE